MWNDGPTCFPQWHFHTWQKEKLNQKKEENIIFAPLSTASPPHDKYYSASLLSLSHLLYNSHCFAYIRRSSEPTCYDRTEKKAFRPGKKNASGAANWLFSFPPVALLGVIYSHFLCRRLAQAAIYWKTKLSNDINALCNRCIGSQAEWKVDLWSIRLSVP